MSRTTELKQQISDLIGVGLQTTVGELHLPEELAALSPQIERTRNPEHGDFSSNIALVAAKRAGMKPRELAQEIVARLPASTLVEAVEIAGPGFINFTLTHSSKQAVIGQILESGDAFGRSHLGSGSRVQVEFVSANPTGPLHVGHGRGAAYGSALCNLLTFAGFTVEREYYVNDAGRQMDILAVSVWLRYLERRAVSLTFPANGYRGGYIHDIAAELERIHGGQLQHTAETVFRDLPPDEPAGGDKEAYIDALIRRMKTLLEQGYESVRSLACDTILADIEEDLAAFGCRYDRWFRESSLTASGAAKRVIDLLRQAGHLYERDGATWFRSTEFGDGKDRVVIRDNGEPTYFATDIAYHYDKCARGFSQLVNIWGADHHGYVPRVKAAMTALGKPAHQLEVLLVQFAALYRGDIKVPMSTRSGEFVTLRDLREEVGTDATRFFYLLHKSDQHMDFDLELAKAHSNDNPVYYVQYAHARICSVLRQAREQSIGLPDIATSDLSVLTESHETDLLRLLDSFPELVESAATAHEPHQLAYYLRDLANQLHTYYNAHQFLVENRVLRDARLSLILAVRQVLANGLGILGVTAPETM